MTRTQLQLHADRRATEVRRLLAQDLLRMRTDAGLSHRAVATAAGVDASVISRLETGDFRPSLETYMRVASALGADFASRVYPNTGPRVRDRHQVRMAELVLESLHPRWVATPEVAVRQPARGWVDLVLHEEAGATLVATELESGLRRIEQLLRWSGDKADSLPSATPWPAWSSARAPTTHRLLVVRWTRANRDAARAARRQLREAYPADPRDALEALTGTARWPGSALLWARLDAATPTLDASAP
jgi:transcriptional regulator with XRE-family HTH domain